MKPEILAKLRTKLKQLSLESFRQIHELVRIERERRNQKTTRIRKWDGHWIMKDCNPNPES